MILVVDLGKFLGGHVVLKTNYPEIPFIVIKEQEIILRLAIEGLRDIELLNIKRLTLLTNISNHITPYV